MTDEPHSPPVPGAEPVTETSRVVDPPTAQHEAPSSDTVKLGTTVSEPARAPTGPPIPPPTPPVAEPWPQTEPSAIDKLKAKLDERPEFGVGAAAAGGVVVALIARRLGR